MNPQLNFIKAVNATKVVVEFVGGGKAYTYKTLLTNLAENDLVLLQQGCNIKLAKVVEVGELADEDTLNVQKLGYDTLSWVFAKVDRKELIHLINLEEAHVAENSDDTVRRF